MRVHDYHRMMGESSGYFKHGVGLSAADLDQVSQTTEQLKSYGLAPMDLGAARTLRDIAERLARLLAQFLELAKVPVSAGVPKARAISEITQFVQRESLVRRRPREMSTAALERLLTPAMHVIFVRMVEDGQHLALMRREPRQPQVLPSGIASLDALLGGGLMTGSSTLLVGPAGTGKSSIAMQFAVSAAERGGSAMIFSFDERPETAIARAAGLHMDVQTHLDDGRLRVQQIDPAELSAGQFAHIIRTEVESHNVSVLVIDSLNGYLQAMPDQRFLLAQMHELLTYLAQRGVATFFVMGQSGVVGDTLSPADASYLMDNMLLFRFFEAQGEVRKAISVVKKRGGSHEIVIRELKFGPEGIMVGEALRQFQGILTGVPLFTGAPNQLMQAKDDTSQGKQEG
jgi:KaiC/GvpD/RAD55 family RecA-like ATPase